MDIGLSVIREGIPVTSAVGAKRVGDALEVAAGETLAVNVGDTVRVDVSFEYLGGGAITLYGAIGSRQFLLGFVEHMAGQTVVNLPEVTTMTPFTGSVDIPIRAVSAGTYDLYVKILGIEEAGMPELSDVIQLAANLQEIKHTIYPWAYTYEGDAEVATFEFRLTPEQIPGTDWLADQIVDSFATELAAQGSRLLELKVSRDTTPTFWTNYLCEVTATVEAGTAGTVGTVGFAWGAVIIAVLAILFIVAIVWAIRTIDSIFFSRSPLADETKALFDRATLEMMVLDLNPETPQADLDAMTDTELRHYLNAILAELQPAGMGWAGIAAIGAVGIVGLVVAAAAFSGRRT